MATSYAIPDNPNQPAVNQPAPSPAVSSQAVSNTPPAGWKGYNGMSWADTNWYNNYSQAVQNGQNNSYQLGKYQQLAKQYGLKDYSQGISQSALQQRSLKALEGDQDSITYLKNMGYTPMSGSALWNGVTNDQLNSDAALRQAYVKANPTADFTRNYDNGFYNKYNNMIQNNQPMTQDEMNWYKNNVQKWNLQDMTNPYVQQQNTYQNEINTQNAQRDSQLKQYQDMMAAQKAQQDAQLQAYQNAYNQQASMFNTDKQNALNAQDVALNNGLQSADANNFQTMLKTQQDMANRGIADSGLAQDAYARATMAANQEYQKAYANAATTKADIASKYDTTLSGLQNDMNNNISKLYDQYNNAQTGLLHDMSGLYSQYNNSTDAITQNMTNSKIAQQQYTDAQAAAQAQAKQVASDAQDKRDQFLTQQTGYIWMNGQPVKDPKTGNPINTLDWYKMSETQRHDLATEYNTAQQNANTYNVNMTNAQTNAQKVQNDYTIAAGRLALDTDKYNLSAQQTQADIAAKQQQLAISAQQANTASQKNAITAASKQLDVANAQALAWEKANPGKTLAKDNPALYKQLQDAYKAVDAIPAPK